MALRAVPDHPKFATLKAILGQPKGPVAGWLEMVWHFTGRFTPQGNIGKYTDEAIEAWVEWDGAPGELIAALTRSGWLDHDANHRLLVHDWAQHADKATKMALSRAKMDFCSPAIGTPGTHIPTPGEQVDTLWGLPVPVPEPVPEPEAKATALPAKGKGRPSFTVPEWIDPAVWRDFEEMRRKIKAPLTDRARANLVAELVRLEAQGHRAEDVLNQSITHSWRGVFAIKGENRNGNGFGGGCYGNRGQQRTDGNVEAARRAAAAIASRNADGAGGGAAGRCESADVGLVRDVPF